MAQATLIPNVKIKDEYGVVFPTAVLLLMEVNLSDNWNLRTEGEGEEYKETESVGGGTYEAWYYCTPQTKAIGAPIKPLRTFENGEFSSVLIVNDEHTEIKALFAGPLIKKDKAFAIIKKDLEIKAR